MATPASSEKVFQVQPTNKRNDGGTMNHDLHGKTVAILATDGFEQSELEKPRAALQDAGAETKVVSIKKGKIKGWDKDHFGAAVAVDVTLKDADPEDYDALLLPGGVMNPDKMRMEPAAVKFVRGFFEAGKPVAAICHGPQLLIEADVVRGRRLTSYPSLKTDLKNAGATWVDEVVVNDQSLVTSRKPDDIPQFNAKMIEEFAEGVHAGQRRGVAVD
jgi:protease I